MGKSKKKDAKGKTQSLDRALAGLKIWQLVLLLIVVVMGTALFVGAASGWFSDNKVTLDAEYYCGEECDGEYMEIDAEGYEKLVTAQKSFVLFVDQGGCKTAVMLRGFVSDYAKEKGIKVYKMMFNEEKETSLYENVKYYPSVVIVRKGKPVVWLRSDSDEDARAYNRYDAFLEWIEKYL